MKKALVFVAKAVLGGLLIVVPIYLAVLLLLKGMKSVVGLVRPFALLLPDWFPAEKALSLLLVLMICFLIGVAVRTRAGRVVRERIERDFLRKNPGLRAIPEPDPAGGGGQPRKRLEACVGRDRRSSRPGIHH